MCINRTTDSEIHITTHTSNNTHTPNRQSVKEENKDKNMQRRQNEASSSDRADAQRIANPVLTYRTNAALSVCSPM